MERRTLAGHLRVAVLARSVPIVQLLTGFAEPQGLSESSSMVQVPNPKPLWANRQLLQKLLHVSFAAGHNRTRKIRA